MFRFHEEKPAFEPEGDRREDAREAMKRIRFKRRRRRLSRNPINVLASAITLLNVYFGVASIFAGVNGDYAKAAYYILLAIIMDMLDGSVARMTHSVSEFGKQLDSLSDVVSFGVAPAVLIYSDYLAVDKGMKSMYSHTGAVIASIFVICGALRLARYNTFQSEMRDYFVGLPIPAAGGTVAAFVLFMHYFELNVAFWTLGPLTLALAYLMVSTVRYPKDKMKQFVLAPRNAFRLLVVFAAALALVRFAMDKSPATVLFPVAALYVLFGIGFEVYHRFVLRPAPTASPSSEDPPSPPSGAL